MDRISSEEITDALLRSGYLLESRLESVLRENGFYVETNSAYSDPESAKSRELDLFAMKGYRVGQYDHELVYSILLIEAVNNPQPIAFITKESQISPLHREDIKVAGLPVKLPDNSLNDNWIFLPEYLEMNEYHHYCQGRVATQYCSFIQKKNDLSKKEWMASHDETHFNNFQTLSLAIEYFQDVLYSAWKKDADAINLEFYYPLIVVQGGLLEVRSSGENITIKPIDHIQYRRTSVVGVKELNYQIDVITERYLLEYLNIIKSEMEKTVQQLGKQESEVRAAIKRIVAQAKNAVTYHEVKASLSYHY
jgi:hypothetical protein